MYRNIIKFFHMSPIAKLFYIFLGLGGLISGMIIAENAVSQSAAEEDDARKLLLER